LNWQTQNLKNGETIKDYVAELQLHMALAGRNLVPNLFSLADSREKLLQETQATMEKLASRQLVS
jgi:hypothetical protein